MSAFDALLADHRRSALRVATVVLGSPVDADDVVQVASERAWRSIGDVDVHRGFRAWFLRIVANTARNHRRTSGRRQRAELRLAAEPVYGSRPLDPLDHVVAADERAVVVAALNRLGGDDRLVIALRHFEQLGERDMAEVLACPAGTVKSRLSRAMGRLRETLATEIRDD